MFLIVPHILWNPSLCVFAYKYLIFPWEGYQTGSSISHSLPDREQHIALLTREGAAYRTPYRKGSSISHSLPEREQHVALLTREGAAYRTLYQTGSSISHSLPEKEQRIALLTREGAAYRTPWRIRFGRGYGPVVRQSYYYYYYCYYYYWLPMYRKQVYECCLRQTLACWMTQIPTHFNTGYPWE
jgi:hypothetical protein